MFSLAATARGPLADALRACRTHLLHAALFSAGVNLLNLAPTLFMLQVYDRVVPSRNGWTLAVLFGVYLLAALTLSGLDFLRTSLLRRVSVRMDRMLAGPVLVRMLRSGVGQGTSQPLREVDTLRQAVTGIGMLALFDVPWVPIYVAVCFLLHPAIGAMAIAGGGALILIAILSEKRAQKLVTMAGRASARAYQTIDASLAAAPAVRALAMESVLVDRHLRDRSAGAVMNLQAGAAAARYVALAKALRMILQSSALALGAYLAIEQQISPGAIFAASLLLGRALAPIEQATGAWNSLTRARAAWDSLAELVGEGDVEPELTRLPDPRGDLATESLTVRSPDGRRVLLDDVSFELKAGEMLTIVGPNGSGKSTLAKALTGAVALSGGAVRLDGARLEHWPAEQRAAAIGYMPQEPLLLPGTIKQNIARFADDADVEERVVAAALLTGVHHFILSLPEAYESRLGPGGIALSIGQAQRIALTRALCGAPKLVVLDEPNSALDAPAEAMLMTTLQTLRERGTTVVVVAHRDRLVAAADHVLVLRDGKLAEFTPRQEIERRVKRPVRATAGAVAPKATPPVVA